MKISTFYEHIVDAAKQSGKTIKEICHLVVSWGITGIEIENKRLINEREEILKTLKETGLEISCIYGFMDFSHNKDPKEGFDFVDLASDLGVKKIMPIPGFLSEEEQISGKCQEYIDRMINAMQEVCSYAKEKNITVVLEDFDNKIAYFSNAAGLKYFLDHVSGLYCTFDTGNFLYSEENSFEVLPLFIDRIAHVHCKDRSFLKKEGENAQNTIAGRGMYSAAVGSGCIQMKEIIEMIRKAGYDDYFAIEHFGSMNQLADMETSAKWLKQYFYKGSIIDNE